MKISKCKKMQDKLMNLNIYITFRTLIIDYIYWITKYFENHSSEKVTFKTWPNATSRKCHLCPRVISCFQTESGKKKVTHALSHDLMIGAVKEVEIIFYSLFMCVSYFIGPFLIHAGKKKMGNSAFSSTAVLSETTSPLPLLFFTIPFRVPEQINQ